MAATVFDMTESTATRLARVESDIAHIQCDVTDIKSDLRQMRTECQTEFRALRGAMQSGLKAAQDESSGLRDAMQTELKWVRGEISGLRLGMQSEWTSVRSELGVLHRDISRSAWAVISLAITLFLALLGALMHGFGALR